MVYIKVIIIIIIVIIIIIIVIINFIRALEICVGLSSRL